MSETMSQHTKKQRDRNSNTSFLPTMCAVSSWEIAEGIPERNILQAVCEHYDIREGVNQTTGIKEWYAFPQTTKGKLTGWVLYRINWKHKDKKWFVVGDVSVNCDLTGTYNSEGKRLIGSGGNRLYVTEGMFDYLSVYQVEYYLQKDKQGNRVEGLYQPNVVSITLGTPNAEEQIVNNHETISKFKQFVTVFDADSNTDAQNKRGDIRGKEATEKVHTSYPEVSYVVELAKDTDPNDYLRKDSKHYNPAELKKLLAFPTEFKTGYLLSVKDFDRSIFKVNLTHGVDVPEFPQLSKDMRGFREHQLIVIAAPPKSGKTTAVMHIQKAFIDQGLPTSGAYFEGSTDESFVRLACLHSKKDYEHTMFSGEALTDDEIDNSIEWLKDTTLFNIASKDVTTETIVPIIRKEAINGKKLFVFDHASYLVEGEAQERKFIRDLMTELANIKKQYPICILLVCHITHNKQQEATLKRMHTSEGSKEWDEPFWYRINSHDARGGSAYAQWADSFICIDKEYIPDERQGRTQLKIAEARLVKRKGRKDILTLDNRTGLLKPEKTIDDDF